MQNYIFINQVLFLDYVVFFTVLLFFFSLVMNFLIISYNLSVAGWSRYMFILVKSHIFYGILNRRYQINVTNVNDTDGSVCFLQ